MKTAFWAVAALFVATPALACEKFPLRSDTEVAANSTAPVRCAGPGEMYSNWPALPERQSGADYAKLVSTTSGYRERNAESGRR